MSSEGVATIKPVGPPQPDNDHAIDAALDQHSPESLGKAVDAAQSGNRPLARLHLEEAIAVDPDNPVCWIWLAWTAESPAAAISALEQARLNHADPAFVESGLAWARCMHNFDATSLLENQASDLFAETDSDADHAESNDEADHVSAQQVMNPDPDTEPREPEGAGPEDAQQHQPISSATIETTGVLPAAIDSPSEAADAASTSALIDIREDEVPEVAGDDQLETLKQNRNSDTAVFADPLPPNDPPSAVPNGNQDAPSTPGQEAASPEQPTILAIDDSPTILSIVRMSLSKHGYDVITAADGMEALNRLESCHPALILMDINMPRLNGYQLCKLIKKHETLSTIPVIMLSGKDGVFDKLRGKMCGCDDYITKPFESADLAQKVASYLTTAPSNA